MKRIALLLLVVFLIGSFTSCKPAAEEDASLGVVEPSDTPDDEDTATETPKEEAPKEEAPKEETPKEETPKEEAPKEEAPKEEAPKEEAPQSKPTPPKEEALANLYEHGNTNTAIGIDGKNAKSDFFGVSKMILVQEGDTVTFGPAASAQVVQGYAFDAAGKPLALINAQNCTEKGSFAYGYKIYSFTVPAKAAGVKLNVHKNVKADFAAARNNAFDLKGYTTLTGKSSEFIDDVLKGRSGLFVGDSICYGSQDTPVAAGRGWAGRIAAETGLTAVNNGRSGASVSDVREVTNRGGTILTQLMDKKASDFDYVLLHGGVNDAWDSVAVGTMEESFDPAYFDTSTFAGGLETLLYNAITTYGDKAAIGYLINFKAPNCNKGRIADMTEYVEMTKKICNKWGITYFDMYNDADVTRDLAFTTTAHTKDYIHPLASGYEVLAPYIADYMREMKPCAPDVIQKFLMK